MKDTITFALWDESIHKTPDQIKRFETAKKSVTTPSSIDKENQTGTFPSSGGKSYTTTLESCTCGDFLRRHLPCKHIYRLAIECNLIDAKASYGVNKNNQISLKEAVSQIENLSDKEQLLLKKFLYENLYHNEKERVFSLSENPNIALCHLVSTRALSPTELLALLKRAELFDLITKAGLICPLPKNSSKSNISAWCIENISNISDYFPTMLSMSFIPEFDSAKRRLYSYLLRKYDWDSYYDENMNKISYPHGAIFEDTEIIISHSSAGAITSTSCGNPNVCHFPNDEITELLTIYGHNRCLHGFDIAYQCSPNNEEKR